MPKKPTLQLTYDKNGIPISGRCSCGDELESGYPRTVVGSDNEKWFRKLFDLHVQQKHSRDD